MNTNILNDKKGYVYNDTIISLAVWENTNSHCKEEFLELPSFLHEK